MLEQQASVASANAIWKRLEAMLGTIGVEQVLAQEIEHLKRYGLSTQKARYLRAFAEAQISGYIDFDRFSELSDEEAGLKQKSVLPPV